jgi:hypothetical protein
MENQWRMDEFRLRDVGMCNSMSERDKERGQETRGSWRLLCQIYQATLQAFFFVVAVVWPSCKVITTLVIPHHSFCMTLLSLNWSILREWHPCVLLDSLRIAFCTNFSIHSCTDVLKDDFRMLFCITANGSWCLGSPLLGYRNKSMVRVALNEYCHQQRKSSTAHTWLWAGACRHNQTIQHSFHHQEQKSELLRGQLCWKPGP